MAYASYWNRVEPTPSTGRMELSLSAPVRDPLWMLTRQWQLGEFDGEDAGSPAFVNFTSTELPLEVPGAASTGQGAPIEWQLAGETIAPDLGVRVELSLSLEAVAAEVASEGGRRWVRGLRGRYPLTRPVGALSPEDERFFLLAQAEHLDGVRLYQDLVAAGLKPGGVLPAGLAFLAEPVPEWGGERLLGVLLKFVDWVEDVFGRGAFGARVPTSWDAERLDYRAECTVKGEAEQATLVVRPDSSGACEWYSFELRGRGAAPAGVAPVPTRTSVIPAHVRFKGMPNPRWWDFESDSFDFSAIPIDEEDYGRQQLLDFMLVAGNDWFVAPLPQRAGTLSRIDALEVRDVFGHSVFIESSEERQKTLPAEQRMTLFTLSSASGAGDLLPGHLLPATAGSVMERGLLLEEVQFARDEMANLAWAIERLATSASGRPWPGAERAALAMEGPASAQGSAAPSGEPRYRVGTSVPPHWIPLLPVLETSPRKVFLRRAMLRTTGAGPGPEPLGHILKGLQRLGEEELSRAGITVSRSAFRARWYDGRAYLWVQRGRTIGAGESSSGLRFDLLLPSVA